MYIDVDCNLPGETMLKHPSRPKQSKLDVKTGKYKGPIRAKAFDGKAGINEGQFEESPAKKVKPDRSRADKSSQTTKLNQTIRHLNSGEDA